MVLRVVALSLAGLLCAEEARAYDWADNHHACIVEHARYATFGEDRFGPWTNAPKTFFVRIKNCADFAKDKGLPFERMENSDAPFSIDKIRVGECAETDFRAGDNVVEFDGLDMSILMPVADLALISYPVANDDGTVMFKADGVIDFGEYGALADGLTTAWFMLRARCTVLKP